MTKSGGVVSRVWQERDPVQEHNGFFPEDGGPLTENVVFISIQRVLVLKRTADLRARSRAGPPNRTILGQALRDDPEQNTPNRTPEQDHFRTGSLGQASGQAHWGRRYGMT